MESSGFGLKDSGVREQFDTGSQRDARAGKGRFDLIPPMALRRLAGVYEKGAAKYDDDNWKKGQPLRRFLDSGLRHVAAVMEGKEDEDHVFQAVWNLVGYAWTLDEIRAGRLPEALAAGVPNAVRPKFPCSDLVDSARAAEVLLRTRTPPFHGVALD